MPEVLTRPPEPKQDHTERLETKRLTSSLRSSSFKYYIHDSVKTLRLQLIGDLTTLDVTELNGTWETAKTTLGQRRLVLDLGQLYSADEDGGLWLAKMKDCGGTCLPAAHSAEGAAVKLSLVGRILGLIRR